MMLTILFTYLLIGSVFAAYLVYKDGLPTDMTDFIALSLVIVLAIVLWPWFIAAAMFDVLKRDKDKDKDIMKFF